MSHRPADPFRLRHQPDATGRWPARSAPTSTGAEQHCGSRRRHSGQVGGTRQARAGAACRPVHARWVIFPLAVLGHLCSISAAALSSALRYHLPFVSDFTLRYLSGPGKGKATCMLPGAQLPAKPSNAENADLCARATNSVLSFSPLCAASLSFPHTRCFVPPLPGLRVCIADAVHPYRVVGLFANRSLGVTTYSNRLMHGESGWSAPRLFHYLCCVL